LAKIQALDRTHPILSLRQRIPAQQDPHHRHALLGAGRRFSTHGVITRLTPGMPGAASC
jgi:hypothetical protein